MITKLIPKKAIVILVLALVSMVIGAFGGYTFCKRAQYKGVIKQQANDATAVVEHQEKKDAVDDKFNENVSKLKAIPDITGCLDKSSDAEYLDQLFKSDSEAKSGFN